MRPTIVSAGVLGLAVLAIFGIGLLSGEAEAKGAAPTRLTGPTGICQFFTPSQTIVGHVVITSVEGPPSPPDFRQVNVNVVLRDAAPNQTFEVWLADLTMQGGVPIGCAANQLGVLTTSKAGVGTFRGSALRFTGERTFQIIVSPDAFGTFSGFVTDPVPFSVP